MHCNSDCYKLGVNFVRFVELASWFGKGRQCLQRRQHQYGRGWNGEWRCCCVVDGAKISMSRWNRSHQKGAASLTVGQDVVATTIAQIIDACRLQNADLLHEQIRCCHAVWKSGGLWW